MKKYGPWIIAAIIVLLVALVISAAMNRARRMDERISLRHSDKIPYGTSAALELLPSVFPDSEVYMNKAYPSYWDVLNSEDSNQAVIMVANHFNADKDELEWIFSFVQRGNYVFIIARSFSYDAIEAFRFSYYENSLDQFMNLAEDSLRVRLEPPAFSSDKLYVYPGRKYESSFYSVDSVRTRILGRTEYGQPNFVQMNTGAGAVFIHSAPLAFSNYFILHKDNVKYFQDALSVIPSTVDIVLWNEYFLVKPRSGSEKDPNWLRVLMNYPAFKWGLLTALITLLLLVISGMRRRQRMIPVYERPRNESLDFVKTLGRLYYDKKDHRNLARKMGAYFLDHVRTRFKLGTQELDAAFVQKLHHKSGYPAPQLEQIVAFVVQLEQMPQVSETELSNFHNQLELFYQNT